ncbi:hypothetical protein MNVI_07240 [Mycobacterium noviomagense]|uniref:Uncharacterized protein n=1 Tax=Mycobacterium noviomagense TaxID=459858 RepID=A0A7I7P9Z5_9MYCO|nr:hypothetical protein BST37_14900 [Mycobacterium noviomagense]BBY05406.1 hypothetical protein MNVI_07240 [Mycobacterium noviomagense]
MAQRRKVGADTVQVLTRPLPVLARLALHTPEGETLVILSRRPAVTVTGEPEKLLLLFVGCDARASFNAPTTPAKPSAGATRCVS